MVERRPITTVTTIDHALAGSLYTALGRSKVVQTLADLNIPFPAELPDITAETSFPVRISVVEDRALSDLQSFWGAQTARVQALLSLTRAEKKRLERVTDRMEKRIFRLHSPANPRSVHVDAVWGLVYRNDKVKNLNIKLDNVTALEIALDGLTRDFQTYLSVIQTEMTWRMSERRALRE